MWLVVVLVYVCLVGIGFYGDGVGVVEVGCGVMILIEVWRFGLSELIVVVLWCGLVRDFGYCFCDVGELCEVLCELEIGEFEFGEVDLFWCSVVVLVMVVKIVGILVVLVVAIGGLLFVGSIVLSRSGECVLVVVFGSVECELVWCVFVVEVEGFVDL